VVTVMVAHPCRHRHVSVGRSYTEAAGHRLHALYPMPNLDVSRSLIVYRSSYCTIHCVLGAWDIYFVTHINADICMYAMVPGVAMSGADRSLARGGVWHMWPPPSYLPLVKSAALSLVRLPGWLDTCRLCRDRDTVVPAKYLEGSDGGRASLTRVGTVSRAYCLVS
jgi:hypothetical protein